MMIWQNARLTTQSPKKYSSFSFIRQDIGATGCSLSSQAEPHLFPNSSFLVASVIVDDSLAHIFQTSEE